MKSKVQEKAKVAPRRRVSPKKQDDGIKVSRKDAEVAERTATVHSSAGELCTLGLIL